MGRQRSELPGSLEAPGKEVLLSAHRASSSVPAHMDRTSITVQASESRNWGGGKDSSPWDSHWDRTGNTELGQEAPEMPCKAITGCTLAQDALFLLLPIIMTLAADTFPALYIWSLTFCSHHPLPTVLRPVGIQSCTRHSSREISMKQPAVLLLTRHQGRTKAPGPANKWKRLELFKTIAWCKGYGTQMLSSGERRWRCGCFNRVRMRWHGGVLGCKKPGGQHPLHPENKGHPHHALQALCCPLPI